MNTNKDKVSSYTHSYRMVGDSMDGGGNRGFIDGDIMFCDKIDIKDIEVDKGYVIETSGGATVRKVISFDGERIITVPSNPSYPNREFTKDEVQGVYLIKAYQRKVADDIDL